MTAIACPWRRLLSARVHYGGAKPMPANRSNPARRAESTRQLRRIAHPGIPVQNRHSMPSPDGISKVGRSATLRHGSHRPEPAGPLGGSQVPRGFPIGGSGYQAAAGRPEPADGPDHQTSPIEPARSSRPESTAPPTSVREARRLREPEGRVLQRVGSGRAPFRSAVVGGALLFAVLGAGVAAAWAMTPGESGSEDVVVTQVDQPGTGEVGPSSSVPTTVSSGVAVVGCSGGSGCVIQRRLRPLRKLSLRP